MLVLNSLSPTWLLDYLHLFLPISALAQLPLRSHLVDVRQPFLSECECEWNSVAHFLFQRLRRTTIVPHVISGKELKTQEAGGGFLQNLLFSRHRPTHSGSFALIWAEVRFNLTTSRLNVLPTEYFPVCLLFKRLLVCSCERHMFASAYTNTKKATVSPPLLTAVCLSVAIGPRQRWHQSALWPPTTLSCNDCLL